MCSIFITVTWPRWKVAHYYSNIKLGLKPDSAAFDAQIIRFVTLEALCSTCSCITVRWHLHLPAVKLVPAAVWYLWWILRPLKRQSILEFPCCIAAISSAFDLKNASPLFLCTDDDSHSNTPCRNLLSCSRKRERERRGKRGTCYFMWIYHTSHIIPVHVSCSTCSVCLITEIPVLISIPCGSLQDGNADGVFAPLDPWIYFAFICAANSLICNREASGVHLHSSDAFTTSEKEKEHISGHYFSWGS